MHSGEQLDDADFSGGLHMGAAAGAGIKPGNPHNAHRPGKLLFGAVSHSRQLLLGGIPGFHRKVCPHSPIGHLLDFRQILRRNHQVKIDGNDVATHVKAHIVAAVPLKQKTGDDMLTGVLLHPQKPGRVVDVSFHFQTHIQRPVADMYHGFPPFPGVQHLHVIQGAGVRRLAAPFGIECGGIQKDFPAGTGLRTGQDLSPERCQVGILVIKLSCRHFLVSDVSG